MKLTTRDKLTLRQMLVLACKHATTADEVAAYEQVLAKIVPLGRILPAMAVDYAKVDLGAAHNGRVRLRNVFSSPGGQRFIVDKGKRIPVRLISASRRAYIHYVTEPQ